MPWSTADVDRFRKGLADEDKEQWVAVANHTRLACLEDGGTETECDAQAVKMANAAMAEVWLELAVPEPVWLEIDIDEGGPGSGNFGHAGIPGQRGGSAPKGGGLAGPPIDENMTAEDAQKTWEESEAQGEENRKAVLHMPYPGVTELRQTLVSDSADDNAVYLAQATWAATSNDSNPDSLAMQSIAATKFDSPLTDWQKARTATRERRLDDKQLNAILDKSYANTQAHLRSQGIGPNDYVTVYRGAAMPKGAAAQVTGKAGIIKDNALISVSLDRKQGAYFASIARDGLPSTHVAGIQTLRVRSRDIVSTCYTGIGSYGEAEMIVLGRGNLGTFEAT